MSNPTVTTESSRGACLRAALILNAVLLALAVILVRVAFESNDDQTLAAFVDGQMAHSTPYIPYIHVALGWALKLIYDTLGRDTAWHTLCQYALLYAGLTALCFAVSARVGALRGAAVSAVLLLFFGVDVYCVISYTKTAAVCTVGGMALLLDAAGTAQRRTLTRALGVLLALFGFMLRPMEFLPCFAIMAALGLRPLWDLLTAGTGAAEKLRRLARLIRPFALVLILAAGLYAVNERAWSREPWKTYHAFDKIRVDYSDYGRPAYGDMPGAYAKLGLSRADVQLLYNGDYFDPETFSADVMRRITEARETNFPPPTAGECVGLLLDRAIPGFFGNLPVYGLLLALCLWLAAGEHGARDWLGLACAAALFALAYLYLIYRGRYLVARADLGLLLALAAAPALTLDAEKLRRERVLTVLLLLLAVITSHYLTRDSYRSAEAEDRSAARAACETLLQDEEHVYLAKLDAVADGLWSPFEPCARGYWDKIVLLGGFDCLHPSVMENLARYGVENPYRDCVGNARVRLIDNDITLTLQFIHEHYDPAARAERVDALSDATGLEIYRILRGEARRETS